MVAKESPIDRWCWRWGILKRDSGLRVNGPVVAGIIAFHSLALLAFIPWLFSWSGAAWVLIGLELFGTLGVTVGYHRLLTHRGFACPRWLEHTLVVLGVCCRQGSPMSWVAVHRMHHQHSDESHDPHSPKGNFFWSHMGWFMVIDSAIYSLSTYDRYARDLFQDRFYKWLERPRVLRMILRIEMAAFLIAGALVGWLTSWTWMGTLQMSLSWLVWGVFVRSVAVWHITWSINSVTHLWGYRNYNTDDNSRNNWLVAVLSSGEGWHNNHHADPRSASHGHRWWEFDLSFIFIRCFEMLGLAWDTVTPRRISRNSPGDKTGAAA